MKKDYCGNSKKSGVYQIRNRINGKVYVGSAKCFQVRSVQHESSLRNGKHSNPPLRNAFKKYGEDAFVFEVIEVVNGSVEKRRTIEQEYINEVWPNCYNVRKDTVSSWSFTPEETKRKHSEHVPWNKGKTNIYSEETKKKISEAIKRLWENEDYALRMSNAAKGRPSNMKGRTHTEEAKEKNRQAHLGKKASEKTKERRRKSMKGKNLGKKRSEEARKKMRIAWVRRKATYNYLQLCL